MTRAIEGSFANGGQRVHLMRVVASDTTQVSVITSGGLHTRLTTDAVTARPRSQR
jgi:hypothetical protein